MWVFGYGSIIWRPAFTWEARRTGYLEGMSRRFWQGSPDHRGVPGAPGRVVTLVPEDGARCWGVLYRLGKAEAQAIVQDLDVREQGGYQQRPVQVHVPAQGEIVDAMTYIASEGNPHWLGPAGLDAMVSQILCSHGPSGANAEYLLRLDESLRALAIDDPHVAALAEAVRDASGGLQKIS